MANQDWAPPEHTPLEQAISPSSSAPVPCEVPGYSDLVEVARGGDSIVYRGRQESLDRDVAIKVIQVTDPSAVARFERELQITVRLGRQHPHIVTVLDTSTTSSGQPCLVMEFHDLGSLHDRLREHGPLPPSEIVDAGTAVADALAFAHNEGVLHRDVKPQNVLLLPTSYVLSDFGIARLADAGHTASVERFSYRHASPQVLDGHPPTPADDIWSLGSTLFTLTEGRAPFASDEPGEDTALAYLRRVRMQQRRPFPNRELPHGLREVIEGCLQADPENRIASAHQVLAMLRAVTTEDRSWLPEGGQAGNTAHLPVQTSRSKPAATSAGASGSAPAPAWLPASAPAPSPEASTGPAPDAASASNTGPAPDAELKSSTGPAPEAASASSAESPPKTGQDRTWDEPSAPREAAPLAPSALAHLGSSSSSAPLDNEATGMLPQNDNDAPADEQDSDSKETKSPQPSGWRRVALFIGGMLITGAAIGVLTALIGNDDAEPDPTPSITAPPVPTSTAPAPTPTGPPQAQPSNPDLAPRKLVIADQGTSALLTWVAPREDVTFISVVQVFDGDKAPVVVTALPASATEYTVEGLDPDARECFAVVGYQDAENDAASGSSKTVCTN